MGNGQPDNSWQVNENAPSAWNTTQRVLSQIDETDVVLHIGDISYAMGYASVVRDTSLMLYVYRLLGLCGQICIVVISVLYCHHSVNYTAA